MPLAEGGVYVEVVGPYQYSFCITKMFFIKRIEVFQFSFFIFIYINILNLMKYLKLYKTIEEAQEAVGNGEIFSPCLITVKENKNVSFYNNHINDKNTPIEYNFTNEGKMYVNITLDTSYLNGCDVLS